MRTWLFLTGPGLVFLVSGCGTILNFKSGNPDLYGGVAKDIEFAWTPRPAPMASGSPPVQVERRSLFLLWMVDLGLSSVADTVTAPVVLCYALFADKTPAELSAPPVTTTQYSVGAVAPAAARQSP
jgi:hypothetical protein